MLVYILQRCPSTHVDMHYQIKPGSIHEQDGNSIPIGAFSGSFPRDPRFEEGGTGDGVGGGGGEGGGGGGGGGCAPIGHAITYVLAFYPMNTHR